MREFEDGDPKYILAVCDAAAELTLNGERSSPHDDVLIKIGMLRAGAFGWREAETLFQLPYANRKPPDARHDAATCGKYAKEADQKADKLCRQMRVPFEFEGHNESLAQMFWTKFCALFIEAENWKTSWQLIALAFGDEDVAEKRAVSFVTHGGTPAELDAWNARRASGIERAVAVREETYKTLVRSCAVGQQYERDKELMCYAHQAAFAIEALRKNYKGARQKALSN